MSILGKLASMSTGHCEDFFDALSRLRQNGENPAKNAAFLGSLLDRTARRGKLMEAKKAPVRGNFSRDFCFLEQTWPTPAHDGIYFRPAGLSMPNRNVRCRLTLIPWQAAALRLAAKVCMLVAAAAFPTIHPSQQGVAIAQTTPSKATAPGIGEAGRIALEELRLRDDLTLRGLVESENSRQTVFIEVFRPQGRPTHLRIRPLDADQIASVKRLSAPERQAAEKLIAETRDRVWIEAGRMDALEFQVSRENDRVVFRYEGEWFDMTSTADDESTRRAIVRLEQVFLAYRQALPPRLNPQSRLSVLLFGTGDEYQEHLKTANLDLANPAFYAVRENQIVAGADLVAFGQQLSQSRTENDAVRKQYDAAAAALPAELKKLNAALEEKGLSAEDRAQEIRAWRTRFQNELSAARRQMRAIERANTTKFNRFAERLLAQLYHEAFHAYVENYVFRHGDAKHQLPRWLNEGLAQVFEAAIFEADTLRLDAPNPKSLALLQADLREAAPLRLIDLLSAGEAPFVASHESDRRATKRHYLYAWGFAYYLIFGPARLDPTKLEQLADREATSAKQLEALLQKPLDEIEKNWRKAMLDASTEKLRPAEE
jgi:hypothetical protein